MADSGNLQIQIFHDLPRPSLLQKASPLRLGLINQITHVLLEEIGRETNEKHDGTTRYDTKNEIVSIGIRSHYRTQRMHTRALTSSEYGADTRG